MMSEVSEQKADMASVSEELAEKFNCSHCRKYLRPPIWIVCKNGHNLCDICKIYLGTAPCPGDGCKNKCIPPSKQIRNSALEAVRDDLNLPISCKFHWNECDFSGDLETVVSHEEQCPFREVPCVVLNCYKPIRFNMIEDHMAEIHTKMANGQWEILPEITHKKRKGRNFAMKSWIHGGTRFFATLITGKDSLWHLWVKAACGKEDAKKLRAKIRLSSKLVPECNDVFYRPVLDFESCAFNYDDKNDKIWWTKSSHQYSSSLHIHQDVVLQHMTVKDGSTELRIDSTIPFTIMAKEFPTREIGAKDVSDQDEKDG